MQESTKKSPYIIVLCIISFFLGIIFTTLLPWVLMKSGAAPILRDIGWEIRQTIRESDNGMTANSTGGVNFPLDTKLFREVYNIVEENYYGFDTVSDNDLTTGMIKGFVGALGDKHSEYFNLDETKKFNEALSGDFEGIGAVVDKNDFGVVVERLIAGSPAKDAGILAGDIITKANGNELKDLSLNDAVAKIRGPAGTNVELEIIRAGEREILRKTVVRRKIIIPSVDGKMVEGTKLGYIALSIFWEKTAEDFKKTLSELDVKNPDGLIIDLRDNGGGYLETAVSILSEFVEKDKTLVTTKEKNPFMNQSYFSDGNSRKKLPIVVLVNENSASASEITAGALKDYNIAIVVGKKTYGKGSVQQPFTLSDGSEIKVTVAKWYTPLDYGIDGVGITPDVEVGFDKEDYEKRYDRQLEEAKKVLGEFIKKKDKKAVIEEYKIKTREEKGGSGAVK